MKKFLYIVTIAFVCLFAATMIQSTKVDAKVSISKIRKQCSTASKAKNI